MRLCKSAYAVLATALLFSATALAQTGVLKAELASHPTSALSTPTTSTDTGAPDDYYVNFFRSANTAGYNSAAVDIVDPGTNGSTNMCANIYVITPDEEMAECCSCPLTADQIIELSVNGNLTANAATGGVVHNGVIKIIASQEVGTACNASVVTPTPALRAWITSDNDLTGVHAVTETQFGGPALSATELASLTTTCAFYQTHLSGHGICTCPTTLLPD